MSATKQATPQKVIYSKRAKCAGDGPKPSCSDAAAEQAVTSITNDLPLTSSSLSGEASKTWTSIGDVTEDADLADLQRIWRSDIRPRFEPAIEKDPLFRSDAVIVRYLNAERGGGPQSSQGRNPKLVAKTAERLESTARFRAEYDCAMRATQAACAYFGDFGLQTRSGWPVMLGVPALMTDEAAPFWKPSDRMLPAQHLRVAMFVVERATHNLVSRGPTSKGVFDVGAYPKEGMKPHGAERYWDADGPGSVEQPAAVLPHLPGHTSLAGLGVLKEALHLMERHYPETMHKIYFYRPSLGFQVIFNIFRLWVPRSTRERFVMVRVGQEDKFFFGPSSVGGCDLDRETAPKEIGGFGPSLDGDRFLMLACEKNETEATLPALDLE
eukprot:CAMPEP_0115835464 /NCGR_PEP_ID=MMETSP0287-20121206/4207_1 /TAXON_ID=412157 /ORGANISM="Chrysochromulina rotalis, Strain UIO044" /LENGTH=382 /DNA_ID=CAMNT_0003288921 /DNA_START=117 /DNA_END=1264 /DNA_ORIENTATION=-